MMYEQKLDHTPDIDNLGAHTHRAALETSRARHLYVHVPFCQRRCSYCDFNTFANMEDRIESYVQALCSDITRAADDPTDWRGDTPPIAYSPAHDTVQGLMRSHLHPTLFLGGGTPTMLNLQQMEQVLSAAALHIPLGDAEVTTEANPGTVIDVEYLRGLRSLGINRISFGVQSLHDPTLRMLGRIHTATEAIATFEQARQAGFDSINLDFIFGLPGQTLDQWRWTLDRIAEVQPEHLSLYSLILEEGTPLHRQVLGGMIRVPDDDLTGAMYELAMERLALAGYEQYEISNWALPGHERGILPTYAAQHNVAYWLNADYLAFGAGAHGHIYPRRWHDILGVDGYIAACRANQPAIAEITDLSPQDLQAETMMMGLRLNCGVSNEHFEERCGVPMDQIYGTTIANLCEQGLVKQDQVGVRLTDRGRLFGNHVFMQFV